MSLCLMAWIGPSEAARRLGISPQALRPKLSRLAEDGQARREGGRWKIRAEGLEVAYDEVTRSKVDSPRRRVMGERSPVAIATAPASPPDEREAIRSRIEELEDDSSISRNEADRRIAVLRARMLQLDLAEREGLLVEVVKERASGFEEARRWRDLLLGIPVRIAADLAAEPDPAAVSIILERALVEALTGLADGTP